jgi:F-type H+-transporting ATPase subunit epsilon
VNTFSIRLMSLARLEQVDDVVSFVAKDGSGSFGVLANAFRRITALSYGVAMFRGLDGTVEYIAFPGGILYFAMNELKIATTKFVRSRSIDEISAALDQSIRVEEDHIREIKRSLHRLDEEIIKRLSSMSRRAEL